uniref:Major facilitator superfamily (MFS) profile domain-containing protein n=1 Tax=Arion vulgaris TaxID=1028688 RepID=A0A0B7A631_9EUPU
MRTDIIINKMTNEEATLKEKEEVANLVNGDVHSADRKDKGPPWWRSQRYVLAYFLFGGMMNIFFQRVNFSIAIICMVNHTAISHHSHYSYNVSKCTHIPNVHDIIIDHDLDSSNTTERSPTYNNVVFHNSKQSEQDSILVNNSSAYFNSASNVRNNNTSSLITSPTSSKNDTTNVSFQNSLTTGCEGYDYPTSKQRMEDGPLIWDKELQGILLGAVYWTYLLVQIPGNIVVRKAKKKTIVLFAMTGMSIMTMLMHVATLWSPWAVFAVKLVQGACTAMVVIAMYGMWSKWAPPSERGSLITLAISGQNLGNIIVFPLSGLLCKYGFLGGWPSIFYVFGALGFLWIILFFIFIHETPATHTFISQEERIYITSSLVQSSVSKQTKVPWRSIMTSPPFWGIVIGQFSFTWGLLLILSTLPQYMFEVLKFDIKSNGVFTMLPYIALMFVTQGAGGISDLVIRKRVLSVLWTRKVCVLIANLVPAILLTVMSFLDSSQAGLAITLLVIAVGASGFSLSGFMVSPYDIGPRFATEMMIVINTVATLPGILTTYIVAAVTKDQTREQWQIVYFLTSGIYIIGALCFCLLARGVVQPWATDGEVYVKQSINVDKDLKLTIIEEKELMLNDSN